MDIPNIYNVTNRPTEYNYLGSLTFNLQLTVKN